MLKAAGAPGPALDACTAQRAPPCVPAPLVGRELKRENLWQYEGVIIFLGLVLNP